MGILAADESIGTIGRRFDRAGVRSTEVSRRAYRELLFTAPGIGEQISGVILFDETIRQRSSDGLPFPRLLEERGAVVGIKVDTGAKPLAFAPGEKVTEGLDGLRERLAEYRELGARFTKWRAVLTIGPGLPSDYCLSVNAGALARFAALSQEAGLVPIVEPEVLADGDHTLEQAYEATLRTQRAVFAELAAQRVSLEHMLLKPNMVMAGLQHPRHASVEEVAAATVRVPPHHRPAGRAGRRLPVRRPDAGRGDRPPRRDERRRAAPVGAHLLVLAGDPGPGPRDVARR